MERFGTRTIWNYYNKHIMLNRLFIESLKRRTYSFSSVCSQKVISFSFNSSLTNICRKKQYHYRFEFQQLQRL
jgi:hypothetical protein